MRYKIRKKINSSGQHPCQICNQVSILVNHHINGRNISGANQSWNLVGLCDNCHRLIHTNNIIIEKWCLTTNGRKLLWHHAGEKSITGEKSKAYIIPGN